MKKVNLTVQFDDEKLDALQIYARIKGFDINTEVEAALQKLFEKHVPKDTREYIEMRAKLADPDAKLKNVKPMPQKPEQKKPDNPQMAGAIGPHEPLKTP